MASYEFLIPLAVVLVFLTICRSLISKSRAAHALPAHEIEGQPKHRHGLLSLVVKRWKTRLTRLAYVVSGPEIIQQAYNRVGICCFFCCQYILLIRGKQAQGQSFVVHTPSNKHLMITSTALIDEVLKSPSDVLSLHAVAKEVRLCPFISWRKTDTKSSCCNQSLQWRGLNGKTSAVWRALGLSGPSEACLHLIWLSFGPRLRILSRRLSRKNFIRQQRKVTIMIGGVVKDGADRLIDWTRIQLFPMIKRIITRVNCHVFFGEELSEPFVRVYKGCVVADLYIPNRQEYRVHDRRPRIPPSHRLCGGMPALHPFLVMPAGGIHGHTTTSRVQSSLPPLGAAGPATAC